MLDTQHRVLYSLAGVRANGWPYWGGVWHRPSGECAGRLSSVGRSSRSCCVCCESQGAAATASRRCVTPAFATAAARLSSTALNNQCVPYQPPRFTVTQIHGRESAWLRRIRAAFGRGGLVNSVVNRQKVGRRAPFSPLPASHAVTSPANTYTTPLGAPRGAQVRDMDRSAQEVLGMRRDQDTCLGEAG